MKGATTAKQEKTGIAGMDAALGGFCQGTLVLLEEEIQGDDALQMLRCFLGQGALEGNSILGYSNEKDLVPEVSSAKQKATEQLRIAWRYEEYSSSKEPEYFFDLSKASHKHFACIRPVDPQGPLPALFSRVLRDVQGLECPLRVCIPDFLGPEWAMPSPAELFTFLVSLRNIARSLCCTFLLSCAVSLLPPGLSQCLRSVPDQVLSCESFHDTAEEFGAFTGILRTVKPLCFHSLQSSLLSLGIKRTSKSLSVEPLSLPPDESIVQPQFDY